MELAKNKSFTLVGIGVALVNAVEFGETANGIEETRSDMLPASRRDAKRHVARKPIRTARRQAFRPGGKALCLKMTTGFWRLVARSQRLNGRSPKFET
jgi:hypothetical protein